jgi:hypothetical protein
VYTTKVAFETSQPGTWRQEAARGFVRELSPNVGGGQARRGEPRRYPLISRCPTINQLHELQTSHVGSTRVSAMVSLRRSSVR